jgi:hypothetical protein
MNFTTRCRVNRAAAHLRRCALPALFFVAFATSAAGQEVGPSGYTSVEVRSFGSALQSAVASNRPGAVASLVHFPLRVSYPNGLHRDVSRAQFVAGYRAIFDQGVQAAIMTEDLDHIFERDQGIMFGNGLVWASGSCIRKDCSDRPPLKVITVNLPSRRVRSR